MILRSQVYAALRAKARSADQREVIDSLEADEVTEAPSAGRGIVRRKSGKSASSALRCDRRYAGGKLRPLRSVRFQSAGILWRPDLFFLAACKQALRRRRQETYLSRRPTRRHLSL